MQQKMGIPGNFPGLRKGTNFAPIAKAIDGPNKNPLASIPTNDLLKCKSIERKNHTT